jgi:alanine racemase
MVRAGLLLYGLKPGPDTPFDGRPAMTLYSVVSQLKDLDPGAAVSYGRTFRAERPIRAAIVAAGYGDGYPRALSGKAHVLIGGRPAPILGVVCMDMLVADVSDVPEVKAGDPVVLFGEGQGSALPVSELAGLVGTIPYELICAVGKRVPRVYLQAGCEVGRTNHVLGDEEYISFWPGKNTR